MQTNQRFLVSRNKREGYYAGHYIAFEDYRARAHRWDRFSMYEFYPPVWGNVFRMLEKEGRI